MIVHPYCKILYVYSQKNFHQQIFMYSMVPMKKVYVTYKHNTHFMVFTVVESTFIKMTILKVFNLSKHERYAK